MQTPDTLLEQLKVINKTLSYEKIARELNVSVQSVYRWLKHKNTPSSLAQEKIEEFISKQKA